MTDREKQIVKSVSDIRYYCKTTGCLYCIFHIKTTRYDIHNKTMFEGERCAIDGFPRKWPDVIGEEADT